MKYFYDTEFIEYPCTIDLVSIGMVCEDGRELYFISNEYDESKASQWVIDNVLAKLVGQPTVSRKEMADKIIEFTKPKDKETDVELWAYYAAYDHVALSWLFGPMIDLPEHIPMWTHDLKQELGNIYDIQKPNQESGEHNALDDARYCKQLYEWIMNTKRSVKAEDIFSRMKDTGRAATLCNCNLCGCPCNYYVDKESGQLMFGSECDCRLPGITPRSLSELQRNLDSDSSLAERFMKQLDEFDNAKASERV